MNRDTPKLLDDVLHAARLMDQFVSGRTFNEYRDDLVLRSAIVRQLQLLGQALDRLSQKDSEATGQIPYYRRLINLGTILRHDDIIEEPVIWDVVQIYLPQARTEAERLLEQVEETRGPEI